MKMFGTKQFTRADHTIPNSDSDLVIQNKLINYRTYEIDGIEIIFRGVKLVEMGKYWRSGLYFEPNLQAAIEFGFIPADYDVHNSNYSWDLIDGIHSYYNPPAIS